MVPYSEGGSKEECERKLRKPRAKSQLPPRKCHQHHRPPPDGSVETGRSALDEERPALQHLQHLQRCKDQMLANGWCHHHVNRLSKLHDLNTFAYLAQRQRSSYRLADHKQCLNHSTCIAYNAACHCRVLLPNDLNALQSSHRDHPKRCDTAYFD
jgi:hypothetical protein